MARFCALTSLGLVEVLKNEIKDMGVRVLGINLGSVYFEGTWRDCYRVNIQSRVATRVTLPVLDFPAYQPDDIYFHLKKFDFTKYISPEQTLAVNASVKDCKLHDQRIVALKAKDAIVDQFRDKFEKRPDVSKTDPTLRVLIRGVRNQFEVSIDTSGKSLFKRGYRIEAGLAPLKEHMAAGLLMLSGWNKDKPVIDLMCGSGTFLIEAALMALDMAPGSLDPQFSFSHFKMFNSEIFNEELQLALEKEKEEIDFKFYGYDFSKTILQSAQKNARRAGVEKLICLNKSSIENVEPPCEKGILVINPPYGARLGEEDLLRDVYRNISYVLKRQFQGWDCWILAGNKLLLQDLKLKATRKFFVMNGNIECRWLCYKIH